MKSKMKKYVVKIKRNGHTFGEYKSPEEASEKLMAYIKRFNERSDGDGYISLFDFVLEEVECKEANEVITDFGSARKYLVAKQMMFLELRKKRFSESVVKIEKAEKLIKELNPKHIEALIALNELFTIAQAWNKADGFVPDFSDWKQSKWYPWFGYNKDAAEFACTGSLNAPSTAHASSGSRLCFKTEERARQFGEQFENLYNKVFI